jgi:ribosomal peptide maturation radical SAM protein 1
VYKISLVNMPFAALNAPSLALTQLSSVLVSEHGDRVAVKIHYLNQEVARYMGMDLYQHIASSVEAQTSGLGEWLFRQLAFPQLADNSEEYFRRYHPYRNERTATLKRSILDHRQGMDQLLDSLIDKHKLAQAELVGFTSTFSQNVASFAMARKLKERNPDVLTVMGGANCETPMGEEIAKNAQYIDFVFSGPALKSFPEFVQYCLDQDIEKCHRIRGVFSKTNCGVGDLAVDGSIGDELSIDTKVELDYEAFLRTLEDNFPSENIKPTLLFETSRGCWWGERAQCTFCGLNGTTIAYRTMSPQMAIGQFESLFRYYPRCSYFESVDNIMPKSHLQEVLPALNTPAGATVFYEVKPNLKAEELQILAKAGVKRVQPGIESLATSTLKLMRKGTTAFHNVRFLKNCVSHGIEAAWNLLVGFPGEGEEVYEKYIRDIPLLTHLPPPSGVYPVRFDRYSPYFVEAEQYGLDLHPYDYYELVYPFSKEALANLAYYFMDHNFGAEYFVTMVKYLDSVREEVELWRSRWHDDPAAPPELRLEDKGELAIVFDSRSGDVIEHEIDDVGRQVLQRLAIPRRTSSLAWDLRHIPSFDAEEEVGALQERGLVFQEGERFMSLVLGDQLSPASELEQRGDVTEQAGDTDAASQEPALVPVSRDAHRAKISSLAKKAGGSEPEGERVA